MEGNNMAEEKGSASTAFHPSNLGLPVSVYRQENLNVFRVIRVH